MYYPQAAILHLNQYIKNEDSTSFNWLLEHQFKELTYLRDGSAGNAKALQWLIVNNHIILGAFINAIWEDKKAFQLLIAKKAFHWAACANIINGDEKAIAFLHKSKLGHYADLAITMQLRIRKLGDEGSNFFQMGSPYK